MNILLRILTCTMVATAATAAAEPIGSFVLDVDDASHLILKSGYGSNLTEIQLISGENTIPYEKWVDFVIIPRDGYLIESVTAYDADGVKQNLTGWTFNSTDDSYSTYFTSADENGYRYEIVTKEYIPVMATVTVSIDHPEAISGGSFKVGNVTVPAENSSTVTFNPDKGSTLSMSLTRSVKEASLTLDGTPVDPVSASTPLSYKFDVSDGNVVSLAVTMETPEVTLTVDDPSHVIVTFPDGNTVLTGLTPGANTITYAVGDELTVKAAEGYRLNAIDGMSYSSYYETYSYYFRGGESGTDFNVTSEVYIAPMATIILDVDDPSLVYNVYTDTYLYGIEAGQNVFEVNTDRIRKFEVYYDVESTDDVIATLDGAPLAVQEWWYDFYSEVTNLEARTYNIVARRRINGDYAGTPLLNKGDDHTSWTLEFTPGGIIEHLPQAGDITISNDKTTLATASVECTLNAATLAFEFDDDLTEGDYTLTVPAGVFTVNGATVGNVTTTFSIGNSGINAVAVGNAAGTVTVYTTDGRLILNAAPTDALERLERGIYIVNGRKVAVVK